LRDRDFLAPSRGYDRRVRTKLAIAGLLGIAAALSAAQLARHGRETRETASRFTKAAPVPPTPVPPNVVLTPVAGPVGGPITAITHAGDDRLFLTLQNGRVLIFQNGAVLPAPFLDVSTLITCCGERGLLSTAFHPDYATNGFFYVDYTDTQGNTVIARYTVSSDANVADATSGVTLLTITQPFANHNGGQLQFGPDGFLYIGMGDGGSANDPSCFAQRREPQAGRQELLGKLLRIDVNQNVGTPPYYGIPAGNPFVGNGGPDEAWAIGLRNPWRFSFDRTTGDLYIGDVGQGAVEEIDFQPQSSPGGENYGWKMMEGTDCTGNDGNCPPDTPPCDSPELTLPILQYEHTDGRCSVTGGYLYRGSRIPDLQGRYVYGDYCSGEIWAGFLDGASWSTDLLPIQTSSLTTFGQDIDEELFVGNGDGNLFRIDPVAATTPVIDDITPHQGFERGYEQISITGSGFAPGAEVLFGVTPAISVTVVSPTELRVVTPPQDRGVVDITVTNPGAPPDSVPAGYIYVAMSLVTPHPNETRVIERP
jgi:glucose/arabinose dehydrogenase